MNKVMKVFAVLIMSVLCWGCGNPAIEEQSDIAVPESSVSPIIVNNAEGISLAASAVAGDLGRSFLPADLSTMLGKSLDKIYSDGEIKHIYTDESVTNDEGNVIVNGFSSLSSFDEVSGHGISGDLEVELKDFTKTSSIDGGAYKATINGTLKLAVKGNLLPFYENEPQNYSNITITGTGANLVATGDVLGTIASLNITRHEIVSKVEGVYQRVVACSGTATIKTTSSTTTCTFQENCLSCK